MFAMYKSMLMAEVGTMLDTKLAPLAKQVQQLDRKLDVLQQQVHQQQHHQIALQQQQSFQQQQCNTELKEMKQMLGAVLSTLNVSPQIPEQEQKESVPKSELQSVNGTIDVQKESVPGSVEDIEIEVMSKSGQSASQVDIHDKRVNEECATANNVEDVHCENGDSDEEALKNDMRALMGLLRGGATSQAEQSVVPEMKALKEVVTTPMQVDAITNQAAPEEMSETVLDFLKLVSTSKAAFTRGEENDASDSLDRSSSPTYSVEIVSRKDASSASDSGLVSVIDIDECKRHNLDDDTVESGEGDIIK
jgi:hypothetical protein